MADRKSMIEAIAINGKIGDAEAEAVFTLYRAEKIITFGAHDGFGVKHGAFLDRDVILRAVKATK